MNLNNLIENSKFKFKVLKIKKMNLTTSIENFKFKFEVLRIALEIQD
jgi:hypothetical protein